MSDGLDLVISGVGATSPVGLSAPSTCSALRAGIARIQELPGFLVDGQQFDKKPALGGRVPVEWFSGGPTIEEWPGHERFKVTIPPPPELAIEDGAARLARIGVPAAREAWAAYDGSVSNPRLSIGLYLGVSEEDDDSLAEMIRDELRLPLHAAVIERAGHAAAFAALRRAAKDLLAETVQVALVGGVDSLIRPRSLARLESSSRLKAPKRPQGILPGEGAGFVVLERSSRPRSGRIELARLSKITLGQEPTAGTDSPNQARALGEVFRTMRAGDPEIRQRALAIADLNGDRMRATEWALASIRVFGDMAGDQEIWHAADCIGDTGAASAALSLVWGTLALSESYARSDSVLAWGASERGLRGAALLTQVRAKEGKVAGLTREPSRSKDVAWD